MAEIGFSRPQGRVTVSYPDDMSVEELRRTLDVHLSVAEAAMAKHHNPPEAGIEKSEI